MTARGMSVREVLDLPVAPTFDETRRCLGMGRSNSYALLKAGEFPVPVLRIGRRFRCRRSDLLAYLGITDPEAAPPAAPQRPQLTVLKPQGDLGFKPPLLRSV